MDSKALNRIIINRQNEIILNNVKKFQKKKAAKAAGLVGTVIIHSL
jgi:hypothetical protein